MENRTRIIGARFLPKDAGLIKKVCILRGEDISVFVRRAIFRELVRLKFIKGEMKKALEG